MWSVSLHTSSVYRACSRVSSQVCPSVRRSRTSGHNLLAAHNSFNSRSTPIAADNYATSTANQFALVPLSSPIASSTSSSLTHSCPNPYYRAHIALLHHASTRLSDAPPSAAAPSPSDTPSSPTPSPSDASSLPRRPRRTTLKTLPYDFREWLLKTGPFGNQLGEWAKLVKFQLSFTATMSSAFGYFLGGAEGIEFTNILANFAGTAACASSAAIINQMMETKYDTLMPRTADRPLVTGTIQRKHAAAAAVLFGAAGAPLLHYAAGGDIVAPILGVGTILLYAGVYTPLKRVHRYNTEIGALIGSLPVLVGWSCAVAHWSHHMEAFHGVYMPFTTIMSLSLPHAVYGYAFQCAWQMQHFMTLAYMYQDQYAGAGYQMIQSRAALNKGLAWTAILGLMPVAGVWAGVTSSAFVLSSIPINGFLLYSYLRWKRAMDSGDLIISRQMARKTLRDGILYFFLMFGLIVYHTLDNKYHLIKSFMPQDMLQLGMAFCPKRDELLQQRQAEQNQEVSERFAAKTPVCQGHHHDKIEGSSSVHHEHKSSKLCVYLMVKQDTLDALEPKAQAASTIPTEAAAVAK